MKQDLAAVIGVRLALNETGRFQPVDQLDGSVVAERKAIRKRADRRLGASGQTLECQQSLMLLRLYPKFPGAHLAEPEKMTELMSKLSQLTIIVQCEVHRYVS